jgi:hypothetical protein
VALKNVVGIDHAVVMVKDPTRLPRTTGGLVSPVCRAAPQRIWDRAITPIMFDPDYMELLGVLRPTEHNEPARTFLEKSGEGIERIAFTAVDSARARKKFSRVVISVGRFPSGR